jgi:hypothetical protein
MELTRIAMALRLGILGAQLIRWTALAASIETFITKNPS